MCRHGFLSFILDQKLQDLYFDCVKRLSIKAVILVDDRYKSILKGSSLFLSFSSHRSQVGVRCSSMVEHPLMA